MVVYRANLGTRRPGVNTSPVAICPRCGEKRFKREFKLKSGRAVKICKMCRRTENKPVESKKTYFERHRLAIYKILKADFIAKKTNEKEVKNMAKVTNAARDFSKQMLELPDKLAAIISKTYLVRGDDPKTLADDEAICRIRDLLEELDPRIIERNKKKRLS